MRLDLVGEDQRFVDEVRAFLAEHWDGGPVAQGYASAVAALRDHRAERFLDALQAQGWGLPTWPKAFGGTGWSVRQQLLFERELADAGAPSTLDTGTSFVGPLLMQHGSRQQQSEHLPGIADRAARWSLAVADAPSRPLARIDGRLTGEKAWVTGAVSADWLLCFAAGWLVVDARAPGVTIEPVPLMGDTVEVGRVIFEGVEILPDWRLDEVPEGWQPPAHPATWTRAQRLQLRFEALAAGLDAQEVATPEWRSVAVDIAALAGVELRAAVAWTEGAEHRPLSLASTVRGVEVGQQLSTLAAGAMGYHALPYPDEHLLSNEGMIGDELALPAVKQMLFDRAWSVHTSMGGGASTEQLKNEMAAVVLGLPRDLID